MAGCVYCTQRPVTDSEILSRTERPELAETVVCDCQLGGVTNPDVNFRGDESGRSAVGARSSAVLRVA